MTLGDRICKLRKKNKITQAELADRLFVTDKTISSWESDRTEPGLDMFLKLSETLGCSIGYLMYGDNVKGDIETEIKIKISESKYREIDAFMIENSIFINESNQIDTYYQPTYRKFLNDGVINEWLRIGMRGSKIILNYKRHDSMYCDEYEVEVDNSENLEKIFNVLGLEKIAVVDKVRKSYLYLDKYEISLDFVKELGWFIEIEVKKYSKSPVEEYEDLLKFAKSFDLNLDNIDKRGYPYHIIYNKN